MGLRGEKLSPSLVSVLLSAHMAPRTANLPLNRDSLVTRSGGPYRSKGTHPAPQTEQVQAYLDAGLDGMIFNTPYLEDREHVELARATLSRLGQLAARSR